MQREKPWNQLRGLLFSVHCVECCTFRISHYKVSLYPSFSDSVIVPVFITSGMSLIYIYLYLKHFSMKLEIDDKLILVTNDDGLYAGGLKTLLEVVEEFGKVILI